MPITGVESGKLGSACLVNTNSRADRCAYDEVHATLRIVDQLIADLEELHSTA